MDVLFQAITTKFNATPAGDLYVSVGGRFYFYDAPPGVAMPYIVYQPISNDTDYNFTSTFDNFRIQFSIFSSSITGGTSEVMNIYNYLTTEYDDCTLTVTGYQFLNFERQFTALVLDADQDIWHYVVDYEVLVRKDS